MSADPTIPPELLAQMGGGRTAADVTEWLTRLGKGREVDPITLGRIINTVRVDDDAATLIRKHNAEPLYMLGQGAMGEVRAAHDPTLRRFVAIKSMKAGRTLDDALVARFVQEALITAQLDHPAIVPVYALNWDDRGVPSYMMKLVRGRTLKEYLAEARVLLDSGKRLDEAHALPARLDLFIKVVDAIQYAHSRGVLHRDLKPDNIMVGEFGEVLVMDWGLARAIEGKDVASVDLVRSGAGETTNGTLVGTPRYMSPEQALARNDLVDVRSDVYGLGLLLHEVVCLRPAIEGGGRDDVLLKAARGELRGLRGPEKISKDLAAVVRTATAHHPKDRYQDAGRLSADLHRVLRDEAVSVRPQGMVGRVLRWISHNRELTLAGILALVVFSFAVTTVLISGGLFAIEAYRQEAVVREERLAALLVSVNGQGQHVNNELQDYEKLLATLSGAALGALSRPPEGRPVYLPADFVAGRPPDLAPSPIYGGRVSLDHADVALAPGLSGKADAPAQLVGLQPVLREVLLRSGGDDMLGLSEAAWRTRVLGDGATRRRLPMVWAYVATKDGVLVGYPGLGRYPEDYDPRAQEWYVAAAAPDGSPARRARWGAASVDESGMGLLVTASQPLFGADGRFLGVAAVDIAIDAMVGDLLDPSRFDRPVEAWLVDARGEVVVSSAHRDGAVTPPFAWPEVPQRVAAGRETGSLIADGKVIAWTWLDALGWTYVVAGEESALLGE